MKNILLYYFKIFAFCLVAISQAIPEELLASPGAGLGRIRQCNYENGNIQDNDGLDFNPSTGGKDSQWVLTNPVCLSVISYSYGSVKTAIHVMNNGCGQPRPIRIFPSIISDFADIARATVSSAGNPTCAAYVAAASTAMSSFMGVLGIIYNEARVAYNNTKICGDGWFGPDTTEYNLYGNAHSSRGIPGYPSEINTTQDIVNECRTTEQITEFSAKYGGRTCEEELSFAKKHYREYFYGGIEVEDNPENGNKCLDPYLVNSTIGSDTIVTSSGTSSTDLSSRNYAPQKYYLRGYEEGDYNCDKYRIRSDIDPLTGTTLTAERREDFKKAYECCLDRSKNYVCINYNGGRKFCKANSKCSLSKGARFVTFETESKDNGSKICVKTYSLCPYNFYVGGGTEACDYYKDTGITQEDVQNGTCGTRSPVRNQDCTMNNKAGKCKNYCQYMRHCVKTSKVYTHNFSDASPYMSQACINFSGDSRNRVTYGSGFLQGSMRHFSAPIVQCFKETLENVFHNRAGHSRCISTDEEGGIDITGICPSGFSYQKGEQVYQNSLFQRFQETLNIAIRLALILVIVFYGIKILTASGEIKKKDLILLITKIAVVMYFATGNAWKDTFFDGVYNVSNFLSELVFKIQIPKDSTKLDGCQFGEVYKSIIEGSIEKTVASQSYPDGKTYLAIWDTLDCKLARYLGFGPEASVANIALLVIAGWLIGPIGAYFVAVVFFFAMLMIILIFRAVHIFLASTMGILLLIFISPITITCILTEKTKGIFNNWLKQLLSFAFQPMILFVYLAIMVSSIDKALVGSARYHGSAPAKMINCTKYCAESNGDVASGVSTEDCNTDNRYVVNPKSDSFECLISDNGFSRFPGLELIGISIPFIVELFTENPKKKMLTLVKGLIMVYFLYKFMDEVPNIASQLFGGAKLPQSTIRLSTVFGQVSGALVGIQKRGGRGAKGAIKKVAKSIGREASRSAQKGQKVNSKESGSDSGGKGGSDDKGKSGDKGGGGGDSKK